jgi:PKD repeat protein
MKHQTVLRTFSKPFLFFLYCLLFSTVNRTVALAAPGDPKETALVENRLVCLGGGRYELRFKVRNTNRIPISSCTLRVTAPAGVTAVTSVVTFNPALAVGATSTERVTALQGNLAVGAQFCFSIFAPGGEVGLEEDCLTVPSCNTCVSVTQEPMECIGGFLNYRMSILNENSSNIQSVRITPNDNSIRMRLGPNFTTELAQVNLQGNISNGNSLNIEMLVTGAGAVPPNLFLFQMDIGFANGTTCRVLSLANPAAGSVNIRAIPFIRCGPPCDLSNWTTIARPSNVRPCCYNFSLDHQLDFFRVTSFDINSTNGAPLLLTPGSTAATRWTITQNSPTGYTIRPRVGTTVSVDNYVSIFDLCAQPGSTTPLNVSISWNIVTANGVILQRCTKTFNLPINCEGAPCNALFNLAGWQQQGTEIVKSGTTINFTNLAGNGPDQRVYSAAFPALDNTWKAEATVNISSVGNNGGAVYPFVFTAGNQPPTRYPATDTNQDALGVAINTPASQTGPVSVSVFMKNGISRLYSCGIVIQTGQNYTIRLERLSATRGQLTVLSGTTIVGTCCFDMPAGIQGLTHVQTSNIQYAWAARRITGSVSNLCLFEEPMGNCDGPNCVTILRDSMYCEGAQAKVLFTIKNNSATPINSVAIVPTSSSITITPALLNVSVPAGATVAITTPFMLTGSGVVPGQDFCYNFDAFAVVNGAQKLNCIDLVFDNCKPIPDCRPSCNADFTFTALDACGKFQFNNTSSPANGATYSWNFGDNTPTDQTASPMHQFATCGTYTVCLTTRCADGTTATACKTVTITDNTPPVARCNLGLGVTLGANCTYTVTSNFVDNGSTDNCKLQSLAVSPSILTGCATHTVTLTATDWCGNRSTCTMGIQTIEITPPTITCPPNTTVDCGSKLIPWPGTPVATDNCPGNVAITFTDVTTGTITCDATVTRTWKATDACNNMATCAQTVFVRDNVPPRIQCPPSTTVACVPPATGPGQATAADNCDPNPVITVTSANTGQLPCNGAIVHTFKATDRCNNMTTCVQTITVKDDLPPTIQCPPNTTVSTLPGLCFYQGTIPQPTGTDNCGGPVTFTCSRLTPGQSTPIDPRTQFPKGDNTISCIANDNCGNSSRACNFILTVQDREAPRIECPFSMTVIGTINAQGQCKATLNNIAPTVSDNCPMTNVTYSISGATTATGNTDASGTMFMQGVSTVVYTVTDMAGNRASCSFSITVRCEACVCIPNGGGFTNMSYRPGGAPNQPVACGQTITWSNVLFPFSMGGTFACQGNNCPPSGGTIPMFWALKKGSTPVTNGAMTGPGFSLIVPSGSFTTSGGVYPHLVRYLRNRHL